MIESAVLWLLARLAIPKIGLTAVFLISFISATLLPMGSEPAVFAVVKADVGMFWIVILVATFGNTLGGMVNYWLGYGAHETFAKEKKTRWFSWLERFGPKAMFMTWLPGVGDPISTLGGWLKLPFWPCVGYMALGKLLRYVLMTWALMHVPDHIWRQIAGWVG
ncbi:MAG: DedA family protein [Oxalobacter sp.]|nr:MAG: DedA family protein [Oxalobacter sp.]